MRPPFSYYGGKQRLAPKIVPLLPPHTVYVEPYLGSGAVFFEKGIPAGASTHYREVINDKNELLIGFFRVLQDPEQSRSLRERLAYTLYSRSEYARALALCKGPVDDPVLMAWAWFVNISMSFAKKAGGGWGTGVITKNVADSFARAQARVNSYADRLRSVHIESEPALEVINRWDSPQTCFYVDPPYPETEQGHYGGFTQADFEQLLAALQDCQGAVVLSCYDNPAVPADWEKHQFEAVTSSRGIVGADRDHAQASAARDDAGRTECVWIKPAKVPARPDLQPIMQRHAAWFRGERPPEQLSLFSEVS